MKLDTARDEFRLVNLNSLKIRRLQKVCQLCRFYHWNPSTEA